jgi:hypothetical protein
VKENAASRALSMKSSPLEGILCIRGPPGEVPSDNVPACGGEGIRVTPLMSSACRLGRESATTTPLSVGGALRLIDGVLELLEGAGGESPGAISAFGPLPSELETARRILGGPPSLLLDELLEELELFELLDEDVLDELLVVLSELDAARRSRGRSGSSSFDELDELLDELLILSSELDAARRSFGRLGSLSLDEVDWLEELDEPDELSSELDDARRSVG